MKNNVVVYKYPLIVQLHPETENMNNWPGNKFLIKTVIKILGVDKNKSAWETIFLVSKTKGLITFEMSLVVFIIFLIALFIYRK